MTNSVSIGRPMCAAGAILLLPSLALAGTIVIATGPNSGVDGYLSIGPDEYGAWASVGFAGAGDLFNPLGGLGALEATFTSGFFLFTASGQRELLSDNNSWQGVGGIGGDASLTRTITSALVASDSSGNGVNDTLQSSFKVFGGNTDLGFDLHQQVGSADPGVAFLRQDYTITNLSNSAINFNMVRTYDGDLVWNGGFENDEVGTGANGAGLGPYVFEQEAGDPGITAVTVSSQQGNNYYGGKHGVDPGGAGLPYNFGTDVQVWEAFGIPSNWENHIAGVGYNTNGVSGTNPPGATPPEDGFIGLDFLLALGPGGLGPGDSMTITVFHTYGQNFPVPAPGALALLGLAGLISVRRRRAA